MNRIDYAIRDIEFLQKYNSFGDLNYAFNISLKFDYIYCETPKAACSSIKRFLIKNECDSIDLFDGEDVSFQEFQFLHHRDFSPLLNIKQLYPFSSHLRSNRFFKFCFVRNPFERLLSAYLDKIAGNRHQSVQIKSMLGIPPTGREAISFERFVDAVVRLPAHLMDPHWKIQYYHNCVEDVPYDFIGKVEYMERDIAHLCERTKLDVKHFMRFSPHSGKASSKVDHFYTPKIKEKVREKYIKDFEFFDYDLR